MGDPGSVVGTEGDLPGQTVLQPSTIPACHHCPPQTEAGLKIAQQLLCSLLQNPAPAPLSLICFAVCFFLCGATVPHPLQSALKSIPPVHSTDSLPSGLAGCVTRATSLQKHPCARQSCSCSASHPGLVQSFSDSGKSVPLQGTTTPFSRSHSGVAGREVTILLTSHFSASTWRGSWDGADAQRTQLRACWSLTATGWQLLFTARNVFRHPDLFPPRHLLVFLPR